MTEQELQDLSCRVAKLLPKDFRKYWQIDLLGRIRTHDSPVWLHDCTEACAEIEARLLGAYVFIQGPNIIYAEHRFSPAVQQIYSAVNGDIMQAWRTVRLLAAEVALTKEKNNG